MALRNEIVSSGKMTVKEFHDAVLSENSMPVEILRNLLTGQTIANDYRPLGNFILFHDNRYALLLQGWVERPVEL